MQSSSQWPPVEPVVEATVIARLDRLGWSPDAYERLEAYTTNHALLTYSSATVLLDLRDGHEVARYKSRAAGHLAFAAYVRREREDNGTP